MKEKRYEAAYAGFVYEAPATHWTPSTVVRQRLTKMDFTKPDGIELGGMPIISDGQTAFVDAADGHTAVLACSGMKKSICGFMPLIVSLAQAGENLIVTDPKGELYDRTAGLLQHRGYQVYCLNFRSMDKDCFNILSYAAEVYRNGDQNKGLSLLSDIVNALAEEQRQRAKDNFWPDTAALWLNGTGAVMLDAFPDIKQVNVLNWSDFNVWSSAQIVEEHLLKKMPDNTAKAALRQCLSSPENTFRSILITASSFFGMFNQNPKLAAMLSHSTFTLGDLTNPKTALFLVTDDTTSTAEPIHCHLQARNVNNSGAYNPVGFSGIRNEKGEYNIKTSGSMQKIELGPVLNSQASAIWNKAKALGVTYAAFYADPDNSRQIIQLGPVSNSMASTLYSYAVNEMKVSYRSWYI